MTLFDLDDEQAVAKYVEACGVQPDHNYLIMQRRASSWVLMANMFTGSQYEDIDNKMARIERYYILIFTPHKLYLQDLTAAPGTDAQVIPTVLIKQFSTPVVKDQYCLRFNLNGKWQNYYCSTLQTQERAYILRNFNTLSLNGFCGLTGGVGAKMRQAARQQQPVQQADPQPYAPSRRANTPSRSSRKPAAPTAKPAAKAPASDFQAETHAQHTPVAKADYIPAEGRPERPYVSPWGRLFGGRKRD